MTAGRKRSDDDEAVGDEAIGKENGAMEGEEELRFADAIENVAPLAGRNDRVAERATARTPRRQAAAARFIVPDPGEPLQGYADGISDSQRRRLRRGQIAPERRVDLHGLRAEAARRACLDEISAAIAARERCLLVVHGRGRSSKEAPVLRSALPGWLADPRLAGRVLAFAPAQPSDGGAGATYVLLRRSRDG